MSTPLLIHPNAVADLKARMASLTMQANDKMTVAFTHHPKGIDMTKSGADQMLMHEAHELLATVAGMRLALVFGIPVD